MRKVLFQLILCTFTLFFSGELTTKPLWSQTPPSGVDLAISEVKPSRSRIQQGRKIDIQVVIANRGSQIASDFYVELRLSKDSAIDEKDHLLKKIYVTNQVLTRVHYLLKDFSIEAPKGKYYLGAIVDSTKKVDETREDNNTAYHYPFVISKDQRGPLEKTSSSGNGESPSPKSEKSKKITTDLSLPFFKITPPEGLPGEKVRLSVVVENSGPSPRRAFYLDFVIPRAGKKGKSRLWKRMVISPFYGKKAKSWKVRIPRDLSPGKYRVQATVDSTKVIEESNEKNNSHQKTLRVKKKKKRPDLKAISIRPYPSRVKIQRLVNFRFKVENDSKVGAKNFNLEVALSKDHKWDKSDVILGQKRIQKELTGLKTYHLQRVIPGSIKEGTYYLLARVDGKGEVAEEDEKNNQTEFYPFVITTETYPSRADLAVGKIDIRPPKGRVGDRVSATIEITNLGDKPAKNFYVDLIVARSEQFGPKKVRVHRELIKKPLTKNRLFIFRNILIPQGTPPGKYYVAVHVDSTNVIEEKNEKNNMDYFYPFVVSPGRRR